MMGEDDKIVKMEEDFSERAEQAIQNAKGQLAMSQNITAVLDELLLMEKQTRLAGDVASLVKIVGAMINLAAESKDWKAFNNYIVIISKRRGQMKQAVSKAVQESMQYLDQTPDMATKLELLETLRAVSAGKIFVEVERARLTRTLAAIREKEGKVSEAADILQEVQVETMGSMEKREKIDFILEQMRLCLDREDYIRAHLIARKVTTRQLNDVEVQDLKIRYHTLLIRYHTHNASYLDIYRCHSSIYDTPLIKDGEKSLKLEHLKSMVIFLAMSTFSPEQADLLLRLYDEKTLVDELPMYRAFLKNFIDKELINWQNLQKAYAVEIFQHACFTGVSAELGKKRAEDFFQRVVEHNIRVISQYYSRVTLKRLSELLFLDLSKAESFLSNMVSEKALSAKIDLVDGIITFAKRKDSAEILNDWSSNVSELLGLVENAHHLVAKEFMVHKIK